ncbi:MAG: M20/M25/M40 family metallo-hydrolase [candidate division Zixibacteria bacterium]|nr:M20/M25/M40 family metallo-hydrolase [candidate division Zixibacteria bacterium]
MRSRSLLIALGLLLIGQIVLAGDLYLAGIENPDQLESLKKLAGHAHGMIGERFLVELSADQASQLADNGILAERILSDYSGERLFLVRSTDPERKPLPEGIEAIFSSKEEFLTRPDYAGLERLRRDRFNVYAVGDMETPLFYHPVSIPSPLMDSYPTDTIANLVSQDSLYSYTGRLQAFRTRCVLSDSIGPVMEWLIDKFQEFGYNNVYPDYCSGINQWNGQFTSGYNVVCIKPGRIQPPKYIMVGAHYDSYTWYPVENRENAPGADDNATGTAAVLEMARILKDVELDYSIMFVPFWGEEIGLLGSKYLGQKLLAEGTKVEFVTNMDMIAYTYDAVDSAMINYPASSSNFGLIYKQASERISQLPSYSSSDHLGSDDYALHDLGFQTTGIAEDDINHNNIIHTIHDSTTRLDFPYMTSMVKFIAAGLAVIAKAPESPAFTLQDFGDGQRIRIHIGDCNPDYSYSVLYGTASGVYTDTIDIPPQTCTYDLGELTTGQIYHIGLVAVNGEGYSSIRIVEKTMIPRIVPLEPYLISAIPDSLSANITWRKHGELDIKEYHVVRTRNMIDWEVGAICTDTTYHDVDVIPHTITWYKVIAVDSALNQSDSSGINQATPATFDWPLLFVDETNDGGITPSEKTQKAFYDSILTELTYTQMNVDTINQN